MGKTSCSFGKNSRAKKSLGVSFLVAPSLLIIVTRLQIFTEVRKEPGTLNFTSICIKKLKSFRVLPAHQKIILFLLFRYSDKVTESTKTFS